MANPSPVGNGKSRRQHELDGTFRKDRHADLKTPEPTSGRPEPPAELDSLEHNEWNTLMEDLSDMGAQFLVDRKSAYQYCKLFAETERVAAQQSEAREGLRVLEDNLGDVEAEDKVALFTQIVALHKTVSKCTDQLRQGRMAIRQYLVEFGLTPSSRGRIRLPATKEEKSDFEKFQARRAS